MMASWVLFAPRTEEDQSLWNSHWIAQETAKKAPSPPLRIEREHAVRASLEAAIGRREDQSMMSGSALLGVALFGHGTKEAILGSDDNPALDLRNIHMLARRWAHAVACWTGKELVPAATDAELFVGYDAPLLVDWNVEDLPSGLRDRLSALVTATTIALLDGVRAKEELMRRVSQTADDLTEWLEDYGEDYGELRDLAEQLVNRMVTSR